MGDAVAGVAQAEAHCRERQDQRVQEGASHAGAESAQVPVRPAEEVLCAQFALAGPDTATEVSVV